jgi:hypothetical protein
MKRLFVILLFVAFQMIAAEPDPMEIVLMKASPPLIVNGIRNPPIVPFQLSPFPIRWSRPFLSLP